MDQETDGSGEKTRLIHTRRLWGRSILVLLLGGAILFSAALWGRKVASRPDSSLLDLGRSIAVSRVIDGDTIELVNGERVRYIGVDAPELRHKVRGRWVEKAEPFAAEAYELNRRLVEGRGVRLELDRESRDRYNRLLSYVFVDHRLVNAELVEAGYAVVRLYPPNLRYADLFMRLEAEARAHKRGLWVSDHREN